MTQNNEIDQRLERLESEFADYRATATASMTRLEQLTTQLVEIAQLHQRALRVSQQKQDTTDAAIQTLLANSDLLNRNVDQLVELAIADRTEIRRIWEYLESQQRHQGNGHG